MNWSRRDLIRAGGTLGAVSWLPGCGRGRPVPALLRSSVKLPPPFQTALRIPPVLKPVRSDADTDYFEMSVQSAEARILPDCSTPIWGYDGVFPGPTVETRSGRACNLRIRNLLPVPIVNHLHGGATPSESDGYPTDFILPVKAVDRQPMAMHSGRITLGEREYVYPNRQRATMLWYHDHRMDFTGAQVWRGLAGLYILRDEEEDSLHLPRGDKELPLVICDRAFDRAGAFIYPSMDPSLSYMPGVTAAYMGGVLGDAILVNGTPWPRHQVSNTRYRLRVLNASNARRYELALHPPPPPPAFLQIGSDGGLLEVPVRLKTVRVAPAERFDLIVDFSRYPVGSTVKLVNLASSGSTADVMRFDIVRNEKDESFVPGRLSGGPPVDASQAVAEREFDFGYDRPSGTWTVNGKPFDEARADALPRLDSVEIWRLRSDFNHPVHLHMVQFRVLSHGGPPGRWDAGWKDTVDLEPGRAASILIRFTGYRGKYVFHCHNLEHEDMAMMANFEVI